MQNIYSIPLTANNVEGTFVAMAGIFCGGGSLPGGLFLNNWFIILCTAGDVTTSR